MTEPRYGQPRDDRSRYDSPPYQPAGPRRSEPASWFEPAGWVQPPDHGGSRRPPPRRRLRRAWTAIRLVVALAVLAIIAYSLITHVTSHKPAHSATGRPSPSTRAGSPVPAVSHPGDVRKYLITAPARAHPWPKPLGTHEKLSLRQAVRLANSDRLTFTRYRFSGGAVRCWITVNSTWVDVRLYRFRSPGDARAFFRFDTRRSARVTPVPGRSSIRGVPGARDFAALKPDSNGILSVVAIGVKGDVEFVADVAEHARTARLGVVDKLMREQYSRL